MVSIPCNVVILPSEELASKSFATSKLLEQFEGFFTLDDDKFFAHSSLYMLQLKTEDLERVETILQSIADHTSAFNLKATKYGQAERYIDVEYEKSSELVKLQEEVLTALDPIRDGMREKDRARMLESNGVARENLERYGYRGIGELFRPHISLTRFKDDAEINPLEVLPGIAQFNGDFNKLGLFEMGDNGTCIRKIAEFKLGNRL